MGFIGKFVREVLDSDRINRSDGHSQHHSVLSSFHRLRLDAAGRPDAHCDYDQFRRLQIVNNRNLRRLVAGPVPGDPIPQSDIVRGVLRIVAVNHEEIFFKDAWSRDCAQAGLTQNFQDSDDPEKKAAVKISFTLANRPEFFANHRSEQAVLNAAVKSLADDPGACAPLFADGSPLKASVCAEIEDLRLINLNQKPRFMERLAAIPDGSAKKPIWRFVSNVYTARVQGEIADLYRQRVARGVPCPMPVQRQFLFHMLTIMARGGVPVTRLLIETLIGKYGFDLILPKYIDSLVAKFSYWQDKDTRGEFRQVTRKGRLFIESNVPCMSTASLIRLFDVSTEEAVKFTYLVPKGSRRRWMPRNERKDLNRLVWLDEGEQVAQPPAVAYCLNLLPLYKSDGCCWFSCCSALSPRSVY